MGDSVDGTRWEAPTQLFKGWADLKRVGTAIRSRGARAALAEARATTVYRLAAWEGRRFDTLHGVETNALVPLADLGVRSSEGSNPNYVPSLVALLGLTLKQLPRDLSDFVFIDMGSGKGRVLLAASQYEFKQVIGVEFAEELHEQAERNIASFSGARRTDVRSVLCDARDFEIPADPCVIYIFGAAAAYAELFEAIVRNVERSFTNSPRPIFLIMQNVKLGSVIERSSVLTEWTRGGALARVALRQLAAVRVFATLDVDG